MSNVNRLPPYINVTPLIDILLVLLIIAPRVLNYGEVVRVIDVIKAAGSAPIGLQIEGLDN
jgi:biopolymer transport protein ExbD